MTDHTISELWRSLLDLNRKINHTLCLLSAEAEISPSCVPTIFKLDQMKTLKINDIAEYLGITIGAASNLLDKLEEKQWVERVRSEEDRRIMFVRLTESGRAQMLRWRQRFEEQAGAIFADLSDRELSQSSDRIDRLSQYLAEYNHFLEQSK